MLAWPMVWYHIELGTWHFCLIFSFKISLFQFYMMIILGSWMYLFLRKHLFKMFPLKKVLFKIVALLPSPCPPCGCMDMHTTERPWKGLGAFSGGLDSRLRLPCCQGDGFHPASSYPSWEGCIDSWDTQRPLCLYHSFHGCSCSRSSFHRRPLNCPVT